MGENFLGIDNWAPNGFVDEEDERTMRNHYAHSIMIPGMYYAAVFPFDGRQNGDESFGGSSYQYAPTEIAIGSAITARNMASAGEFPVQENAPGMSQLVQSLYQRTTQFWQNIRNASGTSWGE